MINIEFVDIEGLRRNGACELEHGRVVDYCFISFVNVPAVEFPLICHNLWVVCNMNY
jgi:hypothetical protein